MDDVAREAARPVAEIGVSDANGTPSLRDVRTSAVASFRFRHSGFSQKTAMPAFIAFIAGSKCTWLGVTIRT